MFGLGAGEIIVILIVGLLLFGSQLPKLARNAGKGIAEFKAGIKQAGEEIRKVDEQAKSTDAPGKNLPPPTT